MTLGEDNSNFWEQYELIINRFREMSKFGSIVSITGLAKLKADGNPKNREDS
jgi:hypothetical protein